MIIWMKVRRICGHTCIVYLQRQLIPRCPEDASSGDAAPDSPPPPHHENQPVKTKVVQLAAVPLGEGRRRRGRRYNAAYVIQKPEQR